MLKAWNVEILGRFIRTVVTTNHAFIGHWINAVHSENVHPLFLGIHISLATGNRIATLQLSFDHYCLIYHIHIDNRNPFPESLRHFLLTNNFVGFMKPPQLRILEALIQGSVRYMRLGVLAAHVYRRPWLRGAGLSALAAMVLRKHIRRPTVPKRWDDWTLSPNQLMHATISPYISLQIALILFFTNAVQIREGVEEDLGKVEYFRILDKVIRVTVTSRQAVIENWIAERQQEVGQAVSYVGFDAELVEINDQVRIGTVQLCVGWQCLVIQVQRLSSYLRFLPLLERFLLHDNNIFAGVDEVELKLRMFVRVLPIGQMGVVQGVDVRTFMFQYWLREAGHRVLAAEVLGGDLEMPEAVEGNWHRRFMLSDHQVFTAVIHALVPFLMANRLNPL